MQCQHLLDLNKTPNVVYAASSPKLQRPHFYRTANGGDTWRQITRDLPDRFPTDLAVDPNNNDLVAMLHFVGFETSMFSEQKMEVTHGKILVKIYLIYQHGLSLSIPITVHIYLLEMKLEYINL